MMLLHDRLNTALRPPEISAEKPVTNGAGTVQPTFEVVPLPDSGEVEGPDSVERFWLGRENWEVLWKIAEEIKHVLCAAASVPGEAPRATKTVRRILMKRLDEIQCRVKQRSLLYDAEKGQDVEQAQFQTMDLDRVFQNLEPGEPDRVYDAIDFTLDDIYNQPLKDVELINDGKEFTVLDRVKDTIAELKWQCDGAKIKPDVIVLAGGGCRLPLVVQLMREFFPAEGGSDPVFHDPKFSKRRMAHGLASYLANDQTTGVPIEPAQFGRRDPPSSRPPGVALRGRHVGDGVPADRPGGHSARRPRDLASLRVHDPPQATDRPATIEPVPQDVARGAEGVRHGRLREASRPDRRLPRPAAADRGREAVPRRIALRGATRIEIRVQIGDTCFGPYLVSCVKPDPEAMLQG